MSKAADMDKENASAFVVMDNGSVQAVEEGNMTMSFELTASGYRFQFESNQANYQKPFAMALATEAEVKAMSSMATGRSGLPDAKFSTWCQPDIVFDEKHAPLSLERLNRFRILQQRLFDQPKSVIPVYTSQRKHVATGWAVPAGMKRRRPPNRAA